MIFHGVFGILHGISIFSFKVHFLITPQSILFHEVSMETLNNGLWNSGIPMNSFENNALDLDLTQLDCV